YRGRGQARMKLGRFAEAGDDYTRALELTIGPRDRLERGGPGRTHLQVLAAQTVTSPTTPSLASATTQLLTVKRFQDAFALRGGPTAPGVELLTHRGWALFFSNAFELALRDFEKARQYALLDPEPYVGSGLCKVMLHHHPEAVEDARAALGLRPATAE